MGVHIPCLLDPMGLQNDDLVSVGVGRYTEDAGLPYFDRAAVIANGYW